MVTPVLPELDLPPRLVRWAAQFKAASLCYDVDPAILAAIIDRESQGGDALTPKGPGGMGDGGNGKGLAQIDGRYHVSFVAAVGPDGIALWRDPAFAILYAAKILKMNLGATGGNLAGAIAAYNASLGRVIAALKSVPPGADAIRTVDPLTTGGNYATDVIARAKSFRTATPTA